MLRALCQRSAVRLHTLWRGSTWTMQEPEYPLTEQAYAVVAVIYLLYTMHFELMLGHLGALCHSTCAYALGAKSSLLGFAEAGR